MSDVEKELRSCVDSFVDELTAIIRRQALEAVEAVIRGDEVAAPARRPGRPAKVVAAPAPAAPVVRGRGRPAKAAAAARRPGEKRTPAQLIQLTDQVHEYIRANAGQGVEQMAKALALATKELTLPIRKLLGDKKITSKGQKRATRYFPR